MRSLAEDSKKRKSTSAESEGLLGLSVFGRSDGAEGERKGNKRKSMQPPDEAHTSRTKRRSLDTKDRKSENHSVVESQLQEHPPKASPTNGSTTRPLKVSKSHHKRSKTIGSTSDIGPSRHGSSSRADALLRASQRPTESFLRSSTLAKARQLVPSGRLDTTQTDYFRLKALGINPVTMSPSTMSASPPQRKRVREDDSDTALKKAPRLTPPKTKMSPTTDPRPRSATLDARHNPSDRPRSKPSNATTTDEDEQLFAQMRSVRQAMSESITWFQDERAKSELSSGADEGEASESSAATRTFVSTPSRTELRLARTGGHGLATKEVASRRSSVRDGKRTDRGFPSARSEGKASGLQGFAALGGGGDGNGNGGLFVREGERAATPALRALGNSVEDAIEL